MDALELLHEDHEKVMQLSRKPNKQRIKKRRRRSSTRSAQNWGLMPGSKRLSFIRPCKSAKS
jgi:hypothetical protein